MRKRGGRQGKRKGRRIGEEGTRGKPRGSQLLMHFSILMAFADGSIEL